MFNNNLKTKSKHFSYIDIYGNQIMISKAKTGKINFTLYHDEIKEGSCRKEFEDLTLNVTIDSGDFYKVVRGMYEISGNGFVLSDDPIRDGRNFIYLEHQEDDSYYMTIGRDLANDLNKPNQTNIELSGRDYENFYQEITSEGLVLTKKLPH